MIARIAMIIATIILKITGTGKLGSKANLRSKLSFFV